ncbi:MAG: hypothetical protein ACLT09_06880 [Flavonifractor plautii]
MPGGALRLLRALQLRPGLVLEPIPLPAVHPRPGGAMAHPVAGLQLLQPVGAVRQLLLQPGQLQPQGPLVPLPGGQPRLQRPRCSRSSLARARTSRASDI